MNIIDRINAHRMKANCQNIIGNLIIWKVRKMTVIKGRNDFEFKVVTLAVVIILAVIIGIWRC